MSKICDLIRNAKDLILVPEIYDCASARASEISGFEVIMVSSGDFACAYTGIPDLRLLSIDEYESLTNRITNMTDMPLILDIDDGFGRPLATYYGCKRFAKAGAAGVLVTDSQENSIPGALGSKELVSARIRAARDGFADSGDDEALIIARCDVDPINDYEEYIERANGYLEAGANMICLQPYGVHIGGAPLAKKLGADIKGWLWWPDLTVGPDGKEEIPVKDLFDWGYKMTGIHYSMHASMIAQLDTGRHVFEERNNAYIDSAYDYTGYKFFSAMSLFGVKDKKWLEIEKKYVPTQDEAIMPGICKFFVRDTDRMGEEK